MARCGMSGKYRQGEGAIARQRDPTDHSECIDPISRGSIVARQCRIQFSFVVDMQFMEPITIVRLDAGRRMVVFG